MMSARKVSAKATGNNPPSFNFNASPRLWFCLACAFLAVSVLRGIRFPSNWSYTHFLVNYDFGFTPRGFVGTVFSFFGGGVFRSYDFMLIFSSAVLFANLFLLTLHLRALVRSRHPIFIGCALIFAAGVAVAYLSYLNGYFDHLGLLTVLLCFRIRYFTGKLIFAATVGAMMILIHEAFLLLFFPLLFVDLWLSANPRRPWHKATVALFSVWILAVSFAVAQAGVLGEAAMKQVLTAYTAEVGIEMNANALLRIFAIDLAEEWTLRQKAWYADHAESMSVSLLLFAPIAAVFLFVANALLRQLNLVPALRWLFLSAPLSPSLLHFVGHDVHRWNVWIVINSFLLLCLLFSRRAEWMLPLPKIWLVIVFAAIFEGGGKVELFDKNQSFENFPFRVHAQYIAGTFTGDHPFLPAAPPTQH